MSGGITTQELALMLASGKLGRSFIFLDARIHLSDLEKYAPDLKIQMFSFYDTNGTPVTAVMPENALTDANVEEYEFFKSLEKRNGVEYNNGEFYTSSPSWEAVASVVRGKSLMLHIEDAPVPHREQQSPSPSQDEYYPLVTEEMPISPTKPAH